jgi:hypothetical protein
MKEILSNPHIKLSIDVVRQVVRFARTAAPIKDFQQAESEYLQALSTLDTLDRSHYGLLIDVRESPLRNDPAFEDFMSRFRERIFSGFARSAVLIKTAVGELQMNRLKREGKLSSGPERKIFRDEEEALLYLQGQPSKLSA